MPDVFANITSVSDEMIETVANVLETRAAVPSQQEMIRDYLARIPYPQDAHVLEIGCGTARVIGVDPSPALLAKARDLSKGNSKIEFEEGDGKALRFEASSFDAVILHTVLTHVPSPEDILDEAFRVLKPGGYLGICDGDFSTATLQTGPMDPLQVCAEALVEYFVTDKWIVPRLSALTQSAGFEVNPIRGYGLVETITPSLAMTWVDRGADALAANGRIGTELAAALKSEGRRRAETGAFLDTCRMWRLRLASQNNC
jgi:arsenite methyltransferase